MGEGRIRGTHDPAEALAAWFLGPRAENADVFERLLTEAFRDHVFWRRNHHPEDGFTIRETDKRTAGYDAAVATLTQELLGLLAELKQGVPFFSGRYKGHMNYEQTIASQIGYFAAMLYNPNNAAFEGSPVTTRIEIEAMRQLARMIGYSPDGFWGHLTSGGTVANFEALWIARNLFYLPAAAVRAAGDLGADLELRRPDGSRGRIAQLDLWELLNVTGDAALELWDALWASAPRADVQRALQRHSLQTLGYQDFGRAMAERYTDTLEPGRVLVPATAHYSWEKIVRALGIGANQLIFVPVDSHYRTDPDALWETVRGLAHRRTPILSLVSICGTTEESAVDRLDLLLEVRRRAQRELGVSFHIHSDAAYGGYAASVLRAPSGELREAAAIRGDSAAGWPDDAWIAAMAALGEADSVTIDPHKLGYVPYPAGAFLLKEKRARELVAIDPPYLLPVQGADAGDDLFLGRFIFEGSRPGAAAVAVWLSHKVLPLDATGHGHLVARTVAGARLLHERLRSTDFDPFRILVLPEPDINIVCYVAAHPSLDSLRALNTFNEAIYAQMSLTADGAQPRYIITRTRFQAPMYDGAVDPLLERLGVPPDEWRAAGTDGLVVLRSTVMDPFFGAPTAPDHPAGFTRALWQACANALG